MVWETFFSGADPPAEAPKHHDAAVEESNAVPTVGEAYECDYERDCTPLYRALENAIEIEEFDPIVKFLDTGYWPNSFFADGVPPADQVKTWVTRFDPIEENKVKWSQLPLHLAIVCGAPKAIIGRLVKMYPQALRCTDDQHMLPLHLALRHNADDDVVAYLLMQFPDAVNAKGKNGRTAIDCALRAKDKLRGKILEIFIEKTKGKRNKAEAKQLAASLQAKTAELEATKADLEAMSGNYESMKTLKQSIETDLLVKIQEIEQGKVEAESNNAAKIDRLHSEKLLDSLEVQKKMEILEERNLEILRIEQQLREEEMALRLALEAIQSRVAKSKSPDDWHDLKREISELQTYRLKTTRSQTQNRIDALKSELDRVEKAVESAPIEKSELKDIKRSLSKLSQKEAGSKSEAELVALKNQVDELRDELRSRAEGAKTRVELSVLKKAMEMELRNSEGKTKEELEAIRKAIDSAAMSELDTKTNQDLANMKMELETLKKDLKNRELVQKTQHDLAELRQCLSDGVDGADNATSEEIKTMKKGAKELEKNLETALQSVKSNDSEVINVKREVEKMQDELRKKETTAKIISEVSQIKSTVETELKKSEGKTQQELLQMKKAIKSLNEKELLTKDVDELSKIKDEINEVKKNLKGVEYATQTQRDLEELKKTLALEIKNTTGKTEEALSMMKKAVDAVNMEQKEGKSLKKTLAEEIKQANHKTEKELKDLKKALDSMDVNKLESNNKEEWDKIRAEMENMKGELKAKQEQTSITSELENIKRTVDALNLDQLKADNDTELKYLRNEMTQMRENLKRKNDDEAELKKEINVLKKSTVPKKGLKKFFARHFSKKNGSNFSMASEITGHEDEPVSTIAPPSMHTHVEASDSSDSSNGGTSNQEILAAMSGSFEGVKVETVQSKETNSQASSANGTSTTPLRKVRSMTPNIPSPRSAKSAVAAH